jgi:hypothetical protein
MYGIWLRGKDRHSPIEHVRTPMASGQGFTKHFHSQLHLILKRKDLSLLSRNCWEVSQSRLSLSSPAHFRALIHAFETVSFA